MKHSLSEVKVYQTSNYDLFSVIDGNRAIDKAKINRIISEINSGNDILDDVPILVTESGKTMDVLDGQHRLEVSKKLKRPVHYILRKNLSLYNIAKVNTNTEKWKARDFINAYKKAGNVNYKKLEEFNKTYKIPIGVCLNMLTYGFSRIGGNTETIMADFQQGRFEVKKYKEAVALAEICQTYSAFDGWNSRSFIVAIQCIIKAELADMDVLHRKFLSDPSQLKTQGTYKLYLSNLEEIYNKGNSKRRTIYG